MRRRDPTTAKAISTTAPIVTPTARKSFRRAIASRTAATLLGIVAFQASPASADWRTDAIEIQTLAPEQIADRADEFIADAETSWRVLVVAAVRCEHVNDPVAARLFEAASKRTSSDDEPRSDQQTWDLRCRAAASFARVGPEPVHRRLDEWVDRANNAPRANQEQLAELAIENLRRLENRDPQPDPLRLCKAADLALRLSDRAGQRDRVATALYRRLWWSENDAPDKTLKHYRRWRDDFRQTGAAADRLHRRLVNQQTDRMIRHCDEPSIDLWLSFDISPSVLLAVLGHVDDAAAVAIMDRVALPNDSDTSLPPMGRKLRPAAVRWAIEHQRFDWVASIAEAWSSSGEVDTISTEVAGDFATAIMRSGRTAESLDWWSRYLESDGVRPAMGLMAAEAQIDAGRDRERAIQWLQIASDAIPVGDSPDRWKLELIRAQWEVRDADFISARSTIGRVEASATAAGAVRIAARAAWMSGELHRMHGDHRSAVRDFRRAEAIDSDGPVAAAALLGAADAFKQLGMTSAAATCYEQWTSRFADDAATMR